MTPPSTPDWTQALPSALRAWTLDHLAVAVADLDAAARDWHRLGARTVEADEAVPEQGVRVRMLRLGDLTLELVAPLADDTPVGRYLAARGGGLHHVALRVPDLEGALDALAADGVALVDRTPRPGRHGTRVAFAHPRALGGVLLELVEDATSEPPTA